MSRTIYKPLPSARLRACPLIGYQVVAGSQKDEEVQVRCRRWRKKVVSGSSKTGLPGDLVQVKGISWGHAKQAMAERLGW